MIQIKAVTVLQDLIKSTEKVNKCFIAQILKFELRFRLLYFWTELSSFLWESERLLIYFVFVQNNKELTVY